MTDDDAEAWLDSLNLTREDMKDGPVPAEIWQQVVPKDVPPELEHGYPHADYTPEPTIAERMDGVKVMDRLDEVMRQRVADMFGVI